MSKTFFIENLLTPFSIRVDKVPFSYNDKLKNQIESFNIGISFLY